MDLAGPRIRPEFAVVAHARGVVEFRSGLWNPRSVTLTDESAPPRLLDVIDMLDGKRTTQEIARELGVDSAYVRSVVDDLTGMGVVLVGPAPADGYLRILGIGPRATLEARPAPSVRVVGRGPLADAVAASIGELADASAVDEDLVSSLREVEVAPHADGLESLRWLERFASLRGSFLVIATEVVNPIVLQNANRVALHYGIPWMQVALDGPFALVGPTFVPHRSPCYECFEMRMSLAIREHASYVAYKRAIADGLVRPAHPRLPRPIEGLLANLAGLEICGYLVGGSNFTVGKVLSIYLPALEFSFNEFLRIPSCRACVPEIERSEEQLHFDLRSYVNEHRVAAPSR